MVETKSRLKLFVSCDLKLIKDRKTWRVDINNLLDLRAGVFSRQLWKYAEGKFTKSHVLYNPLKVKKYTILLIPVLNKNVNIVDIIRGQIISTQKEKQPALIVSWVNNTKLIWTNNTDVHIQFFSV